MVAATSVQPIPRSASVPSEASPACAEMLMLPKPIIEVSDVNTMALVVLADIR